jgi:hypothetical protein
VRDAEARERKRVALESELREEEAAIDRVKGRHGPDWIIPNAEKQIARLRAEIARLAGPAE